MTASAIESIGKEREMNFIVIDKKDGIAILRLSRGKVNALNGDVVDELKTCLKTFVGDDQVKVVILTGAGKFFSFGFDIPEFLSFPKDRFARFMTAFADLYSYVFLYPKPVIAALNGHTMAGGCMLALACDYRVMARGKGKISLNEIGFGASVLAGTVEMLRFAVGSARAQDVLYSGALYSAEEACDVGLVHELAGEEDLMGAAMRAAENLSSKPAAAYASIKSLLRKPVADEMRAREAASIREFVDIWYSDETRAMVKNIQIHA